MKHLLKLLTLNSLINEHARLNILDKNSTIHTNLVLSIFHGADKTNFHHTQIFHLINEKNLPSIIVCSSPLVCLGVQSTFCALFYIPRLQNSRSFIFLVSMHANLTLFTQQVSKYILRKISHTISTKASQDCLN